MKSTLLKAILWGVMFIAFMVLFGIFVIEPNSGLKEGWDWLVVSLATIWCFAGFFFFIKTFRLISKYIQEKAENK